MEKHQAQNSVTLRRLPNQVWGILVVAMVLAWVYWPTLSSLAGRWTKDAEYSHGYMVPLFSAYFLWSRRQLMPKENAKPSWWGLAILLAGLTFRFLGTYTFFDWLGAASLIPCLAGLAVMAGGWQALKWSWPALAFLLFMVPLPYRLETALAQPLQNVATVVSTYTLQTLGFTAYSRGNVIQMGATEIGVVEACSGLSMLLIFFALSTAVVMVVDRPWPDKVVILLSSIPVAIVANVIRITVTGILHKTAGPKLADLVFHDLAGWLMMPLALFLLWGEMKILAWVFVLKPTSRRAVENIASKQNRTGRQVIPVISRRK